MAHDKRPTGRPRKPEGEKYQLFPVRLAPVDLARIRTAIPETERAEWARRLLLADLDRIERGA